MIKKKQEIKITTKQRKREERQGKNMHQYKVGITSSRRKTPQTCIMESMKNNGELTLFS